MYMLFSQLLRQVSSHVGRSLESEARSILSANLWVEIGDLLEAQDEALNLWAGQGPWQDTVVAGLMRDVGKTQELRSFEFGVSLALCVRTYKQ